MNYISKTFLGIDPKFKSTRRIRERLFPKRYLQTEKSPDFITTLNQDILKIELEQLNKNSMNLDNLIENSDKLLK